jgi:hypothetical protein
MKQPLKQIFLLFFAFSFAISIVDCMLDDRLSFSDQIASLTESANFPGPSEDSYVSHFDDVFYFGPEIQPKNHLNYLEMFSKLSVDLKSKYLSCIWQPPRCA